MNRTTNRVLRTTTMLGAAALVVSSLTGVGSVSHTEAAWQEREWVRALTLGTLDCTVPESNRGRGWGRFLVGTLLGIDLDTIVALQGVEVSNSTGTSVPTPGSVSPVPADTAAYRNNLDADLLGIDLLNLGLPLDLEFGTGVYSEYARAGTLPGPGVPPSQAARQHGASGLITDNGAVNLDAASSPNPPRTGTLRLGDLPALGGLLAGLVTDLDLEIGAVASDAKLDGCQALWSGGMDSVERRYLVAGLDLVLASPLVAGFRSDGQGLLTQLGSGLTSLLNDTQAAIATALNGVLLSAIEDIVNLVDLGMLLSVKAKIDGIVVNISLNLDTVTALLDQRRSVDGVTVDLGAGEIRVDLAALLGAIHEDSNGLNGRAPNTYVLSDEVLNAVLERVETILLQIVDEIDDALLQALFDSRVLITADASIDATVLGMTTEVIGIDIDADTTLGSLVGRSGYSAPVFHADATLLNNIPLVGAILNTLTGSLDTLLGAAISGLVPGVLGPIVNTVLTIPATSLISATVSSLIGLVTSLVTALEPVLELVAALVPIQLNFQVNAPATARAPDLDEARSYSVSALRVGVLDGVGGALVADLYFASSSVKVYQ